MLFYIVIIFLIYIFASNLKNKDLYLFELTTILSVFFFSSADPVLGVPLFFYSMFFSVLYYFISDKKITDAAFKYLSIGIGITSIGLLKLICNIGTYPSLILKISNTDLYGDISSQLFYPTFNETVIKHFIFYALYLIFGTYNFDCFKNDNKKRIIIKTIVNSFKIFFVLILIEFLFVNFTRIDDKNLMRLIFSAKQNANVSWHRFGVYTVCLWLAEPSEMAIISIYYLLRINSKYNSKEIMWDVLAVLASLCSGSATIIFLSLIFIILRIFYICTTYKKYNVLIIPFIIIVIVTTSVLITNSAIASKINDFINPSYDNYGSALFRRRSIDCGLNSFWASPIFGQGIGTVLAHSALVQTLANIGISGVALIIFFHKNMFEEKKKIDFWIICKIVFLLIVLSGGFMIQTITSPFTIVAFMAIFYCTDDAKRTVS